MLEIIIIRFVGSSLGWIAIEYYVNKRPLKESAENGLYMGAFLTAGLTAFNQADYQLIIIGTALGIATFLLNCLFGYHVYNQPLKDSIRKGLIVGIVFTIIFLILAKSLDFLLNSINELENVQTYI
ncbi:MAG: hypothetical protein PQ975_01860 [Methanobacterium sp.]|jgi:uncharacterized membrane protein AbrB (regulator of aidB expression)